MRTILLLIAALAISGSASSALAEDTEMTVDQISAQLGENLGGGKHYLGNDANGNGKATFFAVPESTEAICPLLINGEVFTPTVKNWIGQESPAVTFVLNAQAEVLVPTTADGSLLTLDVAGKQWAAVMVSPFDQQSVVTCVYGELTQYHRTLLLPMETMEAMLAPDEIVVGALDE